MKNIFPLNLEAHARRAINYLLTNPSEKSNFIPYFGGKIPLQGPPRLERTGWDSGDGTGRFIEALIYMRRITGDQSGREIDQHLIRNLLSYFNDDGLSYRTATTWNEVEADIWAQRSSLLALSLLYQDVRDKSFLAQLKKLAEALRKIAIWDNDACYLGNFWDGSQWATGTTNPGMCFVGIEGLSQTFEITGDEYFLELAEALAKGMCHGAHRYFNDDGSFGYPDVLMSDRGTAPGEIHETAAYEATNAHVHTRTTAVLGLIHLGILTGNKEYIEFGKRAYDWMRSQSSTFGWVPENMQTAGREVSEMCCVTDMIGIQTLLAKAGYSECWDHIEQYLRNHVIESQIDATGPLSEVLRDNLEGDAPDDTNEISYDNALGRMDGGFAGPIYPNDLFSAYPQSRTAPREQWLIDVSGCCAPSGAKALYLVWDNIVTRDSKGIWVNLALDRDSEWVRIKSSRPLDGRVAIVAHTDLPIYVRVSGWVEKHDVECRVDDNEIEFDWIGDYLCCRHLIAGRELTVRYPLREFKTTEHLGGLPYTVSWRGDTVVKIESNAAPVLPLYQR
jgi:hypothetical protein